MLILVTGGGASGKSELAENLAVVLNKGKMLYIATMQVDDEESRLRVHKHRQMREGKKFETMEAPYGLSTYNQEYFAGYDTALLECLSNLIANEMFLAGKSGPETIEEVITACKKLTRGIEKLIIVSGTILGGLKPYDDFTEEYIRVLGRLNCLIGAQADVVLETVCGIPIIHKGKDLVGRELA